MRVEVLEIALHRGNALLFGSIFVELLEHWAKAVGKREGLHALVVVSELAALGTKQDFIERAVGNLSHYRSYSSPSSSESEAVATAAGAFFWPSMMMS